MMKVAIVKQLLDVSGPWTSVKWADTSPANIFSVWPSRALFWEMTSLLKADWYIIPQQLHTDYTRDAVLQHSGQRELITRYVQGVVEPSNIPFRDYDIIISIDPILNPPDLDKTLFAYYMHEHTDRLYNPSKQAPLNGYDLFLAHIMDAPIKLSNLPQAIAFPYIRDPNTMRQVFQTEMEESAWVDWRLMTFLDMSATWSVTTAQVAERLEQIIGMPIKSKDFVTNQKPYGIADPPLFGDAARYLAAMASCKYYISLGRASGAGQGLGDAASLGCICIGEQDKPYHQLLCHPFCLCEDLVELPQKIRTVRSSPDLQSEIIAWQDAKLNEHFVRQPLGLLQHALELKRSRARTGLMSSHFFQV